MARRMSLASARQVLQSEVLPLGIVQGDDSLTDNNIIIDVHDGSEHDTALTTYQSLSMMPSRTVTPKKYKMVKGKKGKMTKQPVFQARNGNGLPTLPANPSMTFTFRYVTSGSGSAIVKVSDLARSMVAASANNAFRYIFRTIKLNRVTIRGACGDVGKDCQVRLRWLGENTNEITHMDSTIRVDHNACLSLAPPRFSLASFWHDITSSTDNEKELLYVSGQTTTGTLGIVYVDVNMRVIFDEERYIDYTINNNNLSGLNVGGLYYGNLAQDYTSNFLLVPVARKPLGL